LAVFFVVFVSLAIPIKGTAATGVVDSPPVVLDRLVPLVIPSTHLFVSDLDGTLLNPHKELSPWTRAVVREFIQAGGLFTFATARSWTSAACYQEELELRLPVVLFNGAFVFDPAQERNLVSHFLEPDLVARWTHRLIAMGRHPVLHGVTPEGEPRVYYQGVFNPSERHYFAARRGEQDPRLCEVSDFDEVLAGSFVEIMVVGTRAELAPCYEAVKEVPEFTVHYAEDVYCPRYHWLELCHATATKGSAVQGLMRSLGATSLTCYGDNLNDLSMFDVADHACAVANAHPDVLARATTLIGSNDEDGVAAHLSAWTAD
jgi:Cof subfamily protein (haloacid dehalogenase superfamily)